MKLTQVSLIQMNVRFGDKKTNLKKADSLIKEAVLKTSSDIPHIICLPELFSTGYDLNNVQNQAEFIPEGKTTIYLQKLARQYSVILATSIIEEINEKYYNSGLLIDENGTLIGHYRKIHRFPLHPMDERTVFSIGEFLQTNTTFKTKIGNIGLLICFDVRFPEISRRIALDGAYIIIYVAEFPNPRSEIWKRLLQARAMENQIFVCGVNRVGIDPSNLSFFGGSLVFDPYGNILIEGSDKEEILTTTIDPKILLEARASISSLEHRQPTHY